MSNAVVQQKIDSALEILSQNLRSLRLGRAHSDLVASLKVEAYNSHLNISEIASISVPQSDQILIQAWDATLVGAIEKAIQASELNVTPTVEGNSIRIVLPPLTHQRRLDLVKSVKRLGEEARITVRNIRETEMADIDVLLKDKKISEDEKFKNRESIQSIVDNANKTIKELTEAKESDIMNG